ncbi:hypothetical protein ONZ45_g2483 [Pleurotus djamor]|nr:hypothetical protein ONZ45_g2483 [Pleurotus djamor]
METVLTPVVLLAGTVIALHLVQSRKKLPLPPGPPAEPLIGHARVFPTKDKETTLHEWSKQYGDVMCFRLPGETFIVLGSREAAIELLEKRSPFYSSRPGAVVYTLMGADPNLLSLPYGPQFRKHRKLLGPALARSAIRKFEKMQEENAVILVNELIKDKGVNLEQDLSTFSTAVIMRIAAGHQILSQDDDYIKLSEEVQGALQEGGVPGATALDWLPFLQYFPSWFPGTHYANIARKWHSSIRRLYDNPYNTVQKQLNEGTAEHSFLLKHFEALNYEVNGEDADHLKGATAAMISGGSETTWSAMSSFFMAMTVYPECQKAAHEEIDRVVGKDRLPTFQDRDSLPYISGVVNETLRWGRVSPLGVPHRSTHDDIYRGMLIPKGSLVLMNIYGMSVNEALYANPELFNPMRFLPASMGGNNEPPFDDAFGFGRRICPGRHLAAASLWIAIATALSTLNIRKAKDKNGMEITPEVGFDTGLNSHPKPFQCVITPRSSVTEGLVAEALKSIA